MTQTKIHLKGLKRLIDSIARVTLIATMVLVAGPAQSARLLVDDDDAAVTRSDETCQRNIEVTIQSSQTGSLTLTSVRRLSRVAQAAVSYECPGYTRLTVQAMQSQTNDLMYRGHMAQLNDWRLVNDYVSTQLINNESRLVTHESPGRVTKDAKTSPPSSSSSIIRAPRATPRGNGGFQLAHLNLDMPLARTREVLEDQSKEPLLYSRRYRLLTGGTDDCIAEHRSRRDALIEANERCVHASFDSARERRVERVDFTQVLRGDRVHDVVNQLTDRFGSPTERARLAPDLRFTELGFGNVIELKWRATVRSLGFDGNMQTRTQVLTAQMSASANKTRIILTLAWSTDSAT